MDSQNIKLQMRKQHQHQTAANQEVAGQVTQTRRKQRSQATFRTPETPSKTKATNKTSVTK
eukprot:4068634-Amphidinium_carterae.1